MNVKSLRKLIQQLNDEIDYCPPDNTTNDAQWERAIEGADRAGKRLDNLGPIVALLEDLDAQSARIDRLEKIAICICAGCAQDVDWTCPSGGDELLQEAAARAETGRKKAKDEVGPDFDLDLDAADQWMRDHGGYAYQEGEEYDV